MLNSLQALKDHMAKSIHGETKAEAEAKGTCIKCKMEAIPKCHTAKGLAEYEISGYCEECYDKLFDANFNPEED